MDARTTTETPSSLRLAAIQSHLDTLAAQHVLAVETHAGPASVRIQVTPTNPHAAPMDLFLDQRSGYLDLHAGRGFSIDDGYWNQFPAVRVVDAIMHGALREEIRRWRQWEVGISGYLPLPGESRPLYSNRTLTLSGELLRLITGTADKRRLVYEPYHATGRGFGSRRLAHS